MKRVVTAFVAMMAISGAAFAADGARVANMGELKTAAEKGSAVAQNNLAAMYATGEGVTRDLATAAKWYGQAAEQGYAIAQFNLAFMYETGQGVEKDPAAAAVWYSLAAEQGDGWAQVQLATLHVDGKLVQNDLSTAYRWSLVATNNPDREVKAAATDLAKKASAKLSPAGRAEAEKMAKIWRPNR